MRNITVDQARDHYEYSIKILLGAGLSFRSAHDPAWRALIALGVPAEIAHQAVRVACL